ncbi:MAG TPA: DUF2306 domain-containing protein [Silvibacterium sp.]|nr:DUF2306 domain-containing protein [Silvibacterium sp.]
MSTQVTVRETPAPASFRRISSIARPKYLLFAAIALMYAYVLWHNESFLVNAKDPEWTHIHSFRWWLLPHGLLAACALFLGPLQFSDRLRRRFAKVHRVMGRFYVAGVFLGAPLGIYIQHFEERMGGARSFTIAAGVDATLWIFATAMAMMFILRGKVQQHRQWMTRSFATALIFLEGRAVMGVFNIPERNAEIVVWCCVAAAYPIADFALQMQELYRTRPAPAKAARRVPQVV